MKSRRLFIARHGETDYNKKGLLQGRGIDASLNSMGRRQAASLAAYLGGYQADALLSSSLKRSWQTAMPYSERSRLEIKKYRDLDEMDFGNFEGLDYHKVSGELADLQKDWMNGELTLKIPGGESPSEVFERANGAVEKFLHSFEGDAAVLILHGRLIRILLSVWLGYGLENMHKVEHQNGAVNQLVFQNNGFEAVYLNKTSHLVPA